MERISYPEKFGTLVRKERTTREMTQVEFYKFLFPHYSNKDEETIKKKMNKVENGKQVSVDFEFMNALCDKCDVSMDYLLGRDKEYRNHEVKFVCEYTGLDVNAVSKLHKWGMDSVNGGDVDNLGGCFVGENADVELQKAHDRAKALQFLKIINYLFIERTGKKEKDPYSNLSILYSLYLICMAEVETIAGPPTKESIETIMRYIPMSDPSRIDYLSLDASSFLWLIDSTNVHRMINSKEILETIGKNQLNKSIDRMVEEFRKEK